MRGCGYRYGIRSRVGDCARKSIYVVFGFGAKGGCGAAVASSGEIVLAANRGIALTFADAYKDEDLLTKKSGQEFG